MNQSLRSASAATTLAGLAPTALAGPVAPAHAEPIQVTVRGDVEYHQIPAPLLGLVAADEAVTMSFLVDSDTWVDSMTAPTRGYPVDRLSFLLDFEFTDIGWQDPFPVGIEASFVIRDDDPAVDGFILTPALSGGNGPPLSPTPADRATMTGVAQGVDTNCAGFTCLRPPRRVPPTIRLSKLSAGQLRMRWSVTDCEPSADYGQHEGGIGDWYQHASIDGSDELADFSEEIAAGTENRHDLVVPHLGTMKGSDGLDSAGPERPRAPAGCQPGQSTDCPP